jgi:hypothetical protein
MVPVFPPDLDDTLYQVASGIDLGIMKNIQFQGTYMNQALLVLLNIHTSISQFVGRDEWLCGLDVLVLLFDCLCLRFYG